MKHISHARKHTLKRSRGPSFVYKYLAALERPIMRMRQGKCNADAVFLSPRFQIMRSVRVWGQGGLSDAKCFWCYYPSEELQHPGQPPQIECRRKFGSHDL